MGYILVFSFLGGKDQQVPGSLPVIDELAGGSRSPIKDWPVSTRSHFPSGCQEAQGWRCLLMARS